MGGWDGLPLSRRSTERMLRQLGVGYGALLLSCVDEWEQYAAGLPAAIRTRYTPLAKGHHISGLLAACGADWLSTPGMHPPGIVSTVEPASRWPEVNVHSQALLQIHHQPAQPTGPRKKAFVAQLPLDMGLPETTLLCELIWSFDHWTQTRVVQISFNVPASGWQEIDVRLDEAARQYLSWSRREVPWLPTRAGGASGKSLVVPQRLAGVQLPLTHITVRPRQNRSISKGDSSS
jgi:hypothetical protein